MRRLIVILHDVWERLTTDPVAEAQEELHQSTVRLRRATDLLSDRTRQITAADVRTQRALDELADAARRTH